MNSDKFSLRFDVPEGNDFVRAECRHLATILLAVLPPNPCRDSAIQSIEDAMHFAFSALTKPKGDSNA